MSQNKQEKIESLQKRINQLKENIASCKHIWSDGVYDAETYREAYGYKMVAQGSDIWGEPEGYRDAKKDRWSRTCKTCGHKEYTHVQEVVNVEKKPKFQ